MTRQKSSKNDTRFPPSLQKYLDLAFEHKNKKRFLPAIEVLKRALLEFPESGFTNWLTGAIYFSELREYKKAIPFFEEAVRLNPKSEKSSLGLFHSLWSHFRIDDAFVELQRFQTLTNNACRDYREIMEDVGELPLDAETKEEIKNHQKEGQKKLRPIPGKTRKAKTLKAEKA